MRIVSTCACAALVGSSSRTEARCSEAGNASETWRRRAKGVYNTRRRDAQGVELTRMQRDGNATKRVEGARRVRIRRAYGVETRIMAHGVVRTRWEREGLLMHVTRLQTGVLYT